MGERSLHWWDAVRKGPVFEMKNKTNKSENKENILEKSNKCNFSSTILNFMIRLRKTIYGF